MTTVAIGGSGYVTSFLRDFGSEIPARFSVAPLAYDPAVGTWSPTGALVNLPAIFIIILITILLVVGIRESAKVNNVIVANKLVIIVVFILAGVWFVKASNWVTPSNPTGAFIPPNISALTPYRLRPREPGTRSETCRSASRDLSLVITGILPFNELKVLDPIALGADGIGLGWLASIIKLDAILGLSSCFLTWPATNLLFDGA